MYIFMYLCQCIYCCISDPCRHLPHGAAYNDGQSCYGFYVCKKGKSFYKTCKNGFTFHPHKQMCIPDYTCKRDNLVHRKYSETFNSDLPTHPPTHTPISRS